MGFLWGTGATYCSTSPSVHCYSILCAARFSRVWQWEGRTWLRCCQAGGGVWAGRVSSLLSGGSQRLQRGSVCPDGHCQEVKQPTGLALGKPLARCFVSGGALKEPHKGVATVGPSWVPLRLCCQRGNFLVHLGTFRKSQRNRRRGQGQAPWSAPQILLSYRGNSSSGCFWRFIVINLFQSMWCYLSKTWSIFQYGKKYWF